MKKRRAPSSIFKASKRTDGPSGGQHYELTRNYLPWHPLWIPKKLELLNASLIYSRYNKTKSRYITEKLDVLSFERAEERGSLSHQVMV